jgi:hypothetical protein
VTPTLDTRQQSRQARRAHQRHEAERHGWTHYALPLKATLADQLQAKAERDDLVGDRADEALATLRASAQAAVRAVNETRKALG